MTPEDEKLLNTQGLRAWNIATEHYRDFLSRYTIRCIKEDLAEGLTVLVLTAFVAEQAEKMRKVIDMGPDGIIKNAETMRQQDPTFYNEAMAHLEHTRALLEL